MTIIAEILAALVAVSILLLAFLKVTPQALAAAFRYSGSVVLVAIGLVLAGTGRALPGAALIACGLAWIVWLRMARRAAKPGRRKAMVRTAALEMELDHKTGGLEGLVLAGRSEGRLLGRMSRAELAALYQELTSDPESLQLLEAYLDGRFAAWRKNAKSDNRYGLAGAPGPGPMTKEEAYKILGLEAGAAASDVRKAHRRLLQRLNPEVGRASFLAARINEAKDVLLSDHD